jgi:hypothetical protein
MQPAAQSRGGRRGAAAFIFNHLGSVAKSPIDDFTPIRESQSRDGTRAISCQGLNHQTLKPASCQRLNRSFCAFESRQNLKAILCQGSNRSFRAMESRQTLKRFYVRV